MHLSTFFFDLGGVLIDFSHQKMCENLSKLCKLEEKTIKTLFFEDGLGEQYERGIINSRSLHKKLCELSNLDLDYHALLEAASQIFSPKLEMASLLEALKANHFQLILLSNTCEAHFWYAQKHFAFMELFDGFILSYEVKARKPEKKIYEAAIELANVPIDECFYVDDIEEYAQAASKYGIESHHFQGAEKLIQTLKKQGCPIG